MQKSTNKHDNRIPDWITHHHTSAMMNFPVQPSNDIGGADMRSVLDRKCVLFSNIVGVVVNISATRFDWKLGT